MEYGPAGTLGDESCIEQVSNTFSRSAKPPLQGGDRR
jgi:hypothetical protein